MSNELQARKIEKDTATEEIAVALNRFTDARQNPDVWERMCLVRAVSEVFSGRYSLAITDARLALTPLNERSPLAKLPNDPSFERCDLELLRRELRAAIAEPVREFPHFGPIAIVG